jgi:hypothetical protein
MEHVKVREGNSEIIVFLDRYYSTELYALQEAARSLQREIIRKQAEENKRFKNNG